MPDLNKIKIFLSYTRSDLTIANLIASELATHGFEFWIDIQDIRAGHRWDNAIEEAIDTCDVVLVVLSNTSCRSDNVLDEIAYALEQSKRVLPIIVEECKIPLRLGRIESIFLGDNYTQSIPRIVEELSDQSITQAHVNISEADGQRKKPSIAVMPFDLSNTNLTEGFLVDGLLTELTENLSNNPELFVIASGTTRYYRNKVIPLKNIAAELSVDYIVTGQIATHNDRIRVTCELANPHSDQILWSDHFDREIGDLFYIQDEISRAIAHQLQRGVGLYERQRIASKALPDLSAWEIFIKARYYGWSEHWIRESITALERAIELNPNLAEAHALLAARRAYLMWFGDLEAVAQSLIDAERALQLAPDNANCLLCGSVAYNANGKSEEALAMVERALERNPNFADAWAYNGLYLAVRGDNTSALEMLDYAFALSPKDPVRYLWYAHKVICYANDDNYELARNACQESTRLNTQWFWSEMALAQSHAMLGAADEAKLAWTRAKKLNAAVSIDNFRMWLASSSLNASQKDRVLIALTEAGCH